jgi:hypothetical protein
MRPPDLTGRIATRLVLFCAHGKNSTAQTDRYAPRSRPRTTHTSPKLQRGSRQRPPHRPRRSRLTLNEQHVDHAKAQHHTADRVDALIRTLRIEPHTPMPHQRRYVQRPSLALRASMERTTRIENDRHRRSNNATQSLSGARTAARNSRDSLSRCAALRRSLRRFDRQVRAAGGTGRLPFDKHPHVARSAGVGRNLQLRGKRALGKLQFS